jgi:antitoxin (DNA-binding transcriptional repressor) of toxin-antitoxin stability system
MVVTTSALRQNIYSLLDEVLETGVPIEINRRKQRLRIVPVKKPSKLANLKGRTKLKGDPQDIVHLDWSDEWKA